MTRLRSLTMLMLVASGVLATPASAGSPSWSDGSSFNAPQGETGSSSFNAPASGYGRDADGNRTIVDGRFVGNCYFNKDGITPGVGSRSGVDQASGFPANPCNNNAPTPTAQSIATGNSVTVLTQGSWNTVIVAANQINYGDQTAILNGKLHLD